jgi:hypothetical protein
MPDRQKAETARVLDAKGPSGGKLRLISGTNQASVKVFRPRLVHYDRTTNHFEYQEEAP